MTDVQPAEFVFPAGSPGPQPFFQARSVPFITLAFPANPTNISTSKA
jgi:hypothetical protein